MVAEIISYSVTSVTGASIVMARPDDAEEGDLLILLLTIGGVIAEAATLTYPAADWMDHAAASPVTGTGVRTLQAFKYITDSEDSSYTFTYTASRPMVGTLVLIRGAKRDFMFDPVVYPYGYFAPAGPTLGSSTSAAAASITPFPLITTAIDYTLGLYLFTQYDAAAGSPKLDDPSPLIDILHRTLSTTFAVLAMDDFYDTIQVAPAITASSSLSKPWVAVSLAIESAEVPASVDNYKSKLLRRTMPPPYDQRLASTLGKILTVIGTSDNEIGGLFGADDFLPNEA